MKVSGFTIIKNGVKYGYPFKEAILSILPLCDEFIINVGKSEDDTLEQVKSIQSDKIKIFESDWDMSIREGGKVLSIETNKALQKCTGDWCFYIQSDEVLHEKYIPEVRSKMEKYLNDNEVDGLRFKYKHFYGSYDYYQDNYRKWYIKETRVIKNNKGIISVGDAMDFYYADHKKIKSIDINAEIYHYGWVKQPDTLLKKRTDFNKLYHSDEELEKIYTDLKNYDDLGHLKKFNDAHPEVMKEVVKNANWNFDAKINEQKPEAIRKILIFLQPLLKRFSNK